MSTLTGADLRIRIIQAGAGSGKTYTLADEVYRAVRDGKAQPERILLTTFTRKAAAELLDRTGARLIREGLYEEANRIREARIGTVNGVCGSLLRDYAFEAGLPLRQTVLDESQSALLFRRALSGVLSGKETGDLGVLSERLSVEEWRDDAAAIVRLARSNAIPPEAFPEFAARNRERIALALGDPSESEGEFLPLLRSTIDDMVRTAAEAGDTTKVTSEVLRLYRQTAAALERGDRPAWAEYPKIAGKKPGKKCLPCTEAVALAAFDHFTWPSFRADLYGYIDLVFAVASRAYVRYRELKERSGFIDFEDQELLCLKLLSGPDTAERLSFDLVLVDEFQDTSPIQLSLFLKFSELSRESIWVGDPKQAIYGFRGCDPSLMMEALRELERGREPGRLEYSWRSVPELVTFVNGVFPEAFSSQGIPAESVPLQAKRDPAGTAVLESWVLKRGETRQRLTLDLQFSCLARGIQDLLRRTPGLKPSDIAVLARTNRDCARAADALERSGLPFDLETSGLLGEPAAALLLAAYTYIVNPEDAWAGAKVAWYCGLASDRFTPAAWLEERLLEAGARRGSAPLHPAVLALSEERDRVRQSTPLESLRRAASCTEVETRVYLSRTPKRHGAVLESVFALAGNWEQSALQSGEPVTHSGLLGWFAELSRTGEDVLPPGGDEGVRICTWHGSKGLEWPVVIICGSEQESKVRFFGVSAASALPFDLHVPLKGREIVFRLFPYAGNRVNDCGYLERFRGTEAYARASRADSGEFVRLLYVAFTRARDRLVFTTPESGGGEEDPEEQPAVWSVPKAAGEAPEGWSVREYTPCEPAGSGGADHPWFRYSRAERLPFPARYVAPSSLFKSGEGRFLTREPLRFSSPLELLAGRYEGTDLGTAVHRFFAVAWNPMEEGERKAVAAECASRLIAAARLPLDPQVLAAHRENFDRFLAGRWPQAVVHRELPLRMEKDGRITAGSADLVLESPEWFIVMDYKLVRPDAAADEEFAERYGPQLSAYADVLRAALGRPCAGMFLCLPLRGELLEVVRVPLAVRLPV